MNKYLTITFLFMLYGCSTSQIDLRLIGVSKVTKQQYLLAPKKYKAIETSYGNPLLDTGNLYGYGNIFYKLTFRSSLDLNKKKTNIVGIVPEIRECLSGRELGMNYIYNLPSKDYITFFSAQEFYGKYKHDFLTDPKDLCFSVRQISMLGDKKANTIRISKELLK